MRTFILILFSLILVKYARLNEYCSADKTCTEPDLSDGYLEVANAFAGEVNDAVRAYKHCEQQNCTCYFDVIDRDLKPFRNGIKKGTIEAMRSYGVKYQIIDHKLYREKDCNFPARCAGIEHFIKPLLKKLPNIEMIINCRDWPQVVKNHPKHGPVFSFSKTNDYSDIMYPAWSFWEGGPAIKLYPTGIGRWDQHRKSLRAASKEWPWHKKQAKAFFRGSRTSEERDSLVLLSREDPDLVDAQYTKNQAWKSPKDTLGAEPASEVSFEDHCQYKYLFNFRGVAASFRFKHLFLCKSLVFHVGDEWKEFFYDALKPWIHYIPLKSNPSKEDIRRVLQFLKENDDMGEEIAARGYSLIQKQLKLSDVQCYWKQLLKEYAKLIKYKVVLDQELIEI